MPFATFVRRVALRSFTAVLLAIPAVQAYVAQAQLQSRVLATAEVPFAFNVGSSRLPAGSYRVIRLNQNMMRLASMDGSQVTSIMVYPSDKRAGADHGKLVFHDYAGHYFLSSVLLADDSASVDVVKNRAEKEAMRMAAMTPASTIITQVALSGTDRR